MRILGIDSGYANLAYCEMESEDHTHPLEWTCCRILEGKYSEKAFFEAAYRWVRRKRELFERADRIVLERQMTPKFAVINIMIRTLYYDKAVEYNPQTVGAHFGFPRDRESKKRAAVSLVGQNAAFPQVKKKDDLADAYLLAIYDLQFHFGFLEEGLNDVRTRVENNRSGTGRKRGPVSLSLSSAIPPLIGTKRPLLGTKRRLTDSSIGSSEEGSDSEC